MKNLLVSLLLTIFFIFSISAQNTSQNNINGVIKDRTGAVVSAAEVQLINAQRIVLGATKTDAQGRYRFENVAVGSYLVVASRSDFSSQSEAVQVTANNTAEVNLILEINQLKEQVTVTAETGLVEEIQNVPQAVTVISIDEILQRTNSVLSFAAKEEVGINVQRTSPSIGAIVVRGLTGKNVVNFVDGVRYTNGAQRGGINTFFNLNDPSNFQTIEVLRGPNGAQYGSDSLAGTVNLLTKSPAFGDERELHGEIIPSLNIADRSFGNSLLLSYGTNKFGGYVNIFATAHKY